MRDPAAHEAHDLPLAERIVEQVIHDWVTTAADIARAGFGDLNDYERGARQGIDQMQYLHLSGAGHTVAPRIVDALKRACLVNVEES